MTTTKPVIVLLLPVFLSGCPKELEVEYPPVVTEDVEPHEPIIKTVEIDVENGDEQDQRGQRPRASFHLITICLNAKNKAKTRDYGLLPTQAKYFLNVEVPDCKEKYEGQTDNGVISIRWPTRCGRGAPEVSGIINTNAYCCDPVEVSDLTVPLVRGNNAECTNENTLPIRCFRNPESCAVRPAQ